MRETLQETDGFMPLLVFSILSYSSNNFSNSSCVSVFSPINTGWGKYSCNHFLKIFIRHI